MGSEACFTGKNSCLVLYTWSKARSLGGHRPWHGGGEVSATAVLKRQVVKLILNINFFLVTFILLNYAALSLGQRLAEGKS